MTGSLAIFVKTPGQSPVKTRLARHIGQLKAEAFHFSSAEAVASVAVIAGAEAGFKPHWAVAEPAAMDGNVWKDLPCLPQGPGNLGERMDAVYRQLRTQGSYGLLVGADAPQLRVESLVRAARWLDDPAPRLVIGRARDGGFWLFGGNVPLPPEAWLRVVYSQEETAHEFARVMSPHGQWLELELLTDVDRLEDLPAVSRELRALNFPTIEQQRLLDWLQDANIGAGVLA